MKILLVNKYHYVRGGAERAYFDMAKILESYGHQVAFFSMKHKNNQETEWSKYFIDNVEYEDGKINFWQKISVIFKIFYNRQAARNLEKLIDDFKPDVAHLHNIYHQLSPSIIWVLYKRRVPIVMTLHDYKLVCPNYNMFAHGRVWEKTKWGSYWRAVADKAVKNSYLKSAVCALEGYFHYWFGFYDKVDFFISPSRFLIDKFKEKGFPYNIQHLRNPYLKEKCEGKRRQIELGAERNLSEKYILYFGRLSAEKGLADALNAFAMVKAADIKFYIVGDGPERERMKKLADSLNIKNKILFLGAKHGRELDLLIKNAYLVVVPSVWYENAPYSVIETMAQGKIIIASCIGGIPEMITDGETGLLYTAGDMDELVGKIKFVLENKQLKSVIEKKARQKILTEYEPEKFYKILINIYQKF